MSPTDSGLFFTATRTLLTSPIERTTLTYRIHIHETLEK